MTGPETRLVNQCTYVQSRPVSGDGGSPVQTPFLKLGILITAVDRPELVNHILPLDGAIDPVAHDAVNAAWQGDTRTALSLLAHIALHTVTASASAAVAKEMQLWQIAAHDLDGAISHAAQTITTIGQATWNSGKRGPAQLGGSAKPARAAAAETVAVRQAAQAHATTLPPQGLRESVGQPETVLADTLITTPVLATVSPTAVQARLAEAAPQTAAFLAASGFFALPAPTLTVAVGETARMVAFTALKQYLAQEKANALAALSNIGASEPIGYLHLERLAFTPIGYERGDIVYSLPMLPGETVRLTHSEWSRTSQDFSQLVATSLETAKQDAVAEKSELTESIAAQQQHASAFNSSTTASGGFGPVQISETVGVSATQSQTDSRQSSAKRSQEITKQASSRSKEEHKITFNVSTTYEVADQSFREFTNTSDREVRWDFFRLMKKWQIDLYRYDVRLTYDIVIPEPGSYLLRRYIRLQYMQRALDRGFHLDLEPSAITDASWQDLSLQYNVALDPPPEQRAQASAHAEQTFSNYLVGSEFVEVALPEGYEFDPVHPVASAIATNLYVRNSRPRKIAARILPQQSTNEQVLRSGAYRGTSYFWEYGYEWIKLDNVDLEKGDSIALSVTLNGVRTSAAYLSWQTAQYAKIVDAAKAVFESDKQRLQGQFDRLKAELAQDDGLALRKIEREEIMKGVMRWILGPTFSFYPSDLPELTLSPTQDLPYYSSDTQLVDPDVQKRYPTYGDQIRFLHHAIEWENVNYVLYPYFWTGTRRWDFKQALHHDDFEHRGFLRAGAARVVLTIRPHFEKAFLSFMANGTLDTFVGESHPYFKISDEIRAMADTTYPYTQNPNAEDPNNHVATWYEFTPTAALDVAQGTTLAPEPPPPVAPGTNG